MKDKTRQDKTRQISGALRIEMETHALVCILMVMLMVVMMFIVVVMTKRWGQGRQSATLSKRLHLLQQSGHDCDCAPAEGGFYGSV